MLTNVKVFNIAFWLLHRFYHRFGMSLYYRPSSLRRRILALKSLASAASPPMSWGEQLRYW